MNFHKEKLCLLLLCRIYLAREPVKALVWASGFNIPIRIKKGTLWAHLDFNEFIHRNYYSHIQRLT